MSSLIFLGFSVLAFVISFGIVFMVASYVLGMFFAWMATMPTLPAGWETAKDTVEAQAQWLLPLIMLLGMFILVLKVLMVASVRGRD